MANPQSRIPNPEPRTPSDLFHQRIMRREHRAVADLERRHLVEQPEISFDRNLAAIEMQQMVEREADVRLAQPRDHVEHVSPERLQVAVQRLGHPVHRKVHDDVAVGQKARHLFADDHIRQIGTIVQQLQRAADRIVIGERHEIHPARFRDAVHVRGLRVAVAAAKKPHVAAHVRVAAVDVQIGAKHRHHLSGFSSMICRVVEPSCP
jgi:hypothetical protein